MSAAAQLQPASGTNLEAREEKRLELLERVIAQGLAQFLQVGSALLEIRERRLYRKQHGSFEDYCRQRWGFRRAHAYRLIQAARVVETLSPVGDTGLASERQARELVPLLAQPDQLHKAWEEAHSRADAIGVPLTAAHVRTAVRARLEPVDSLGSLVGSDRWETPPELFGELDREFGFRLDVCALSHNAKCARFYTPERDGLRQAWRGVCWMNPPYDALPVWVEKAARSASEGATVVALLPAATETGWWWEFCRHAEIRFIRGRLRFSNAATAAAFASAVVVFGRTAKVVWWEWRQPPRRPLARPLASSEQSLKPARRAGRPVFADATPPASQGLSAVPGGRS